MPPPLPTIADCFVENLLQYLVLFLQDCHKILIHTPSIMPTVYLFNLFMRDCYLGASPETVLLFSTIVTFQALISHCNVEIRAGWFNYLLVGTELHRFHHSANLSESKNYAVTLSFIDIIFGTFYYRPGTLPERLGIVDPSAYPHSNDFWKVMKLPFERESKIESGNRGFSEAPAADLP